MATLSVIVGGAILNAAAFISSNAINQTTRGDTAKEEQERHNRALEAQEAANENTRRSTQNCSTKLTHKNSWT